MPTIDIGGVPTPYRLPRPRAALWIAQMTAETGGLRHRSQAAAEFMVHTVGARVVERIAVDTIRGEWSMDEVADVIYRILEAGSARKYYQDGFLCRFVVARWPQIRGLLIGKGIADPMALPTLFALLDAAEQLYLEGADKEARTAWQREYNPPPDVAARMLTDAPHG